MVEPAKQGPPARTGQIIGGRTREHGQEAGGVDRDGGGLGQASQAQRQAQQGEAAEGAGGDANDVNPLVGGALGGPGIVDHGWMDRSLG